MHHILTYVKAVLRAGARTGFPLSLESDSPQPEAMMALHTDSSLAPDNTPADRRRIGISAATAGVAL